MHKWILAAALAAAPLLALAQAKAPELSPDIKKDIERHRTIAAAHEQAAKCLASGQKHEVCQKQLQGACKGIAIGKYCGMRHEH